MNRGSGRGGGAVFNKNSDVLGAEAYKCDFGGEWKPVNAFSNKKLRELQSKVARGVKVTAATTGMICREHSGEPSLEMTCEGPCGLVKPLAMFSKNTRAKGVNVCIKCTAFQLQVRPVEDTATTKGMPQRGEGTQLTPSVGPSMASASITNTTSKMSTQGGTMSWENDDEPYAPVTESGISSPTAHDALSDDGNDDDDGANSQTTARSHSPTIPPHMRGGNDMQYLHHSSSRNPNTATSNPIGFPAVPAYADSVAPSDSASQAGYNYSGAERRVSSGGTVSTATTYREMMEKRENIPRGPKANYFSWDNYGQCHERTQGDTGTTDSLASYESMDAREHSDIKESVTDNRNDPPPAPPAPASAWGGRPTASRGGKAPNKKWPSPYNRGKEDKDSQGR